MLFPAQRALLTLLAVTLPLSAGDSLSRAAIDGNLPRVKTCLAGGEKVNDIDKWGWTPLLWATYYQYEPLTKWLLDHGADPNIQSTKTYKRFAKGITPLWMAGYYGLDNLVSPLMAAKADPNIKDSNGMTPLEAAQSSEFQMCVDLMVGKTPAATRTLPHMEGKLGDILVLIQSGTPKSQDYLNCLKRQLEAALEARKVRHLIQVEDPLGLDDAEQARKRESFKPRYVVVWTETNALIMGSSPYRSKSDMHVSLWLPGSKKAIWEKDTSARLRPVLDSTEAAILAGRSVEALLLELEGDRLL